MKKIVCLIVSVLLLMGMAVGCSQSATRADNEIQIFMANGNYFTDAKKDSIWQKIESDLGIQLEFQGYTHNDDYYVTLNPKLNGGRPEDYPDVIFAVPDVSTAYTRWANQESGVLQDGGE